MYSVEGEYKKLMEKIIVENMITRVKRKIDHFIVLSNYHFMCHALHFFVRIKCMS